MNDREFINFLIKSYLSNAKNPHQATLDNTFANRLNDIADKLEKQEKVIKIIKEKNVDFGLLKRSENWLDYYTRFKHRTGKNTEITQEEFDLLKRYCNEQDNKKA